MIKKKEEIIWILPSILVLILLVVVKSCTPRINREYSIGRVNRKDISLFCEMRGEIKPDEVYPIGLDIKLKVDEIYVKEGMKIKKGAPLIKFSDYKKLELEKKITDVGREAIDKKKQLLYLKEEERLGSNEGLEESGKLEGDISKLENDIDSYKKEYSLVQRVILSPIDGYVIKINVVKNGENDISKPVMILAKDNRIKIISEAIQDKVVKKLKLGMDGDMISLNNPNNKIVGKLYKIKKLDSGFYILEFMAKNINNLSFNEILNIRINYEKKENVLTVPIKAVMKEKDRYFIYTIDKEDKVQEKEVSIGINNGEDIEIIGDLKENTEIIVDPDNKLHNNVIVKRRELEKEREKLQKRIEKIEGENRKREKEIEDNKRELIKLKREIQE